MIGYIKKKWNCLVPGLIGILCLSTACNGGDGDKSVESISLKGSIVRTDTLYSRSFRPILSGNILFTTQPSSQDCMYMGRLEGDSLKTLDIFLRYGEGPDEFGYIEMACDGDSALVVLDSRGGRALSVCRFNYGQEGLLDRGIRKYDLKSVDRLTVGASAFVSLSDSTILVNSTDYDSPGIFAVVDYKNGTASVIPWMPDDGFTGDKRISQSLYTENTQLFRIGDRFLYVCGAGRYAFTFTLEDGMLKVDRTLLDKYPEYKGMDDDINYLVKRNVPQLTAAVSDDRIYLLEIAFDQDGNPASDSHTPMFGNIVHCYDFSGNPLTDYILDRPGYSILVDKEDNNMYLYSINDETLDMDIVRYPLPDKSGSK